MTDGDHLAKMVHYGYKGALSPGRPAMMGLRTGKLKVQSLAQLHELGVAAFVSLGGAVSHIPDSAGLSDAEIQKMPKYVRSFKCSGSMEGGDPYCKAEKWSKDECPSRYYQTSWHPGL
jgi:hypothetical protein